MSTPETTGVPSVGPPRCGRWLCPLGATLLVGLPLLVVAGWTLSGRWPDTISWGDDATTELAVRSAVRGEQFTGPYSRFGFHHPGPIAFYLVAPFYAMAENTHAAFTLAAALLNLLALATILAVVYRVAGRSGMLWTGLLLIIYLRMLDLEIVFSFCTPFLIVVPCMAAIVLIAAVAAGRLAYLPAALLAASFVVQSHVSATPALAGATVFALAAFVVRRRRAGLGLPSCRSVAISRANWIIITILLLAWVPPVVEQLTTRPGNMTHLFAFFSGNGRQRSWEDALARFIPLAAAFPAGGMAHRITPLGSVPVLASCSALEAGVFSGQVVLVLAAYAVARRRGRNFLAVLALLYLMLAVICVFSLQRIVGGLHLYLAFWMTGLGPLAYGVIVGALLPPLFERLLGLHRPGRRRAAVAALRGLVIVGGVINGVCAWRDVGWMCLDTERDPLDVGTLTAAVQAVRPAGEGACLVSTVDHAAWPTVAGLIARLERVGYDVHCEAEWGFMYGARRVVRGPVRDLFLVCHKGSGGALPRGVPARVIGETKAVLFYWQPIENAALPEVLRELAKFRSRDGPSSRSRTPVGVAAQPRPPAPLLPKLDAGVSLHTADAPRWVSPADGVLLHVLGNTHLVHHVGSELTLRQGEIFVDLTRRATRTTQEAIQGFVVNTPGHEVVARAAAFAVAVRGETTRVAAIKGDVFVEDTRVPRGTQHTYRSPRGEEKPVVSSIAWTMRARALTLRPPTDEATTLFDETLTGDPDCENAGHAAAGRAECTRAERDGKECVLPRRRPPPPPEPARVRRDWIFLFECSGDRDPEAARAQIDVVETILHLAEDDETFVILAAAADVDAFPGGRMATAPNIARALEFLDQTPLAGDLDLGDALTAIGPYRQLARNPVLVHLGAGRPTRGQRDAAALARQIPEGLRYVGLQFDADRGASVMPLMARGRGSFVVKMDRKRDMRTQTLRVLAGLDGRELPDVRITAPADTK